MCLAVVVSANHELGRIDVLCSSFFFFNDTATTEIYTLSLHDALPISSRDSTGSPYRSFRGFPVKGGRSEEHTSELQSRFGISYAVFCLKTKKKTAHPFSPIQRRNPSSPPSRSGPP